MDQGGPVVEPAPGIFVCVCYDAHPCHSQISLFPIKLSMETRRICCILKAGHDAEGSVDLNRLLRQ